MAHKAERQAWILEWLKANFCADVCNQAFHEAYFKRFPEYPRKEKLWGAQPVKQAMDDLRDMERDGIVEGKRLSLSANWQPGFPRSLVGYTLKES